MFMDFESRSEREELLDDPRVDPRELCGTLDGLERVNALLGGYKASIEGVASLAQGRDALSILDVGTGCGDTPRQLARWAQRRCIDLYVKGIDRSEVTVDHARSRSIAFRNIDIEGEDLFDLPEREHFDIVHAALVLHHLSDEAIVEALRKMYAISRLGIVINDLHRHRLGYLGSRLVLPLISKNRLVRHDGPVSVLRAFTREDLLGLVRRAGLPEPEIRWRPLFRWQMILRREHP